MHTKHFLVVDKPGLDNCFTIIRQYLFTNEIFCSININAVSPVTYYTKMLTGEELVDTVLNIPLALEIPSSSNNLESSCKTTVLSCFHMSAAYKSIFKRFA